MKQWSTDSQKENCMVEEMLYDKKWRVPIYVKHGQEMSKFKLVWGKRILSLNYVNSDIFLSGFIAIIEFFFFLRIEGSVEINSFQFLLYLQGNWDREINRAQSLQGIWKVYAHSTALTGWFTAAEGNMESHRFLTHTCSSVLHCMGFPRQKLGNYFQLQSHQLQSGQLNFLNIYLIKPLLYLMASTLNLSFNSWIMTFWFVFLFYCAGLLWNILFPVAKAIL